MRRRQVHGVDYPRPFRNHLRPMSNTAKLATPARTFLTLPGSFIPICGIQPPMFRHHTTTFLPTLMTCLWLAIDDLRHLSTIEPIPLIGPLPFKADALPLDLFGKLACPLAQVDRCPF